MMKAVQKQYGVTNNLTELEIPWTRGKRAADGPFCVMTQPDERTTGILMNQFAVAVSLTYRYYQHYLLKFDRIMNLFFFPFDSRRIW